MVPNRAVSQIFFKTSCLLTSNNICLKINSEITLIFYEILIPKDEYISLSNSIIILHTLPIKPRGKPRKRKNTYIWVKAFKNGSSKIYGRQPLKNLK